MGMQTWLITQTNFNLQIISSAIFQKLLTLLAFLHVLLVSAVIRSDLRNQGMMLEALED